MNTARIGGVQSRAYWRVLIRPTVFNGSRIEKLTQLEDVVRECVVQLRGWDYPHWPREGVERHADGVDGSVDWEDHKEYWKAFRSGQFIHLFAMREDWQREMKTWPGHNVDPGTAFWLENALFALTEIYAFAARWTARLVVPSSVEISVSVFGLRERRLRTLDPRRMDFLEHRKASVAAFEHSEEYDPATLMADPHRLALPVGERLLELFGWDTTVERLAERQAQLLSGR